jgi:hypothetical protein
MVERMSVGRCGPSSGRGDDVAHLTRLPILLGGVWDAKGVNRCAEYEGRLANR